MKQRLIKRVIGAFIALGVLITGGVLADATVAPAPEAQAFSDIVYIADCPGTATYQQLVIVSYESWDHYMYVHARRDSRFYSDSWGPWITHTYKYQYAPAPQITYVPIQYRDVSEYKMVDAHFGGSTMGLDWTYHVDCFYN